MIFRRHKTIQAIQYELIRRITHGIPVVWAHRETTWMERCLPDFLIIGAQKSGTSSLHAYLMQHPQIISATRKEVHFFDGGHDQNLDTRTQGQSWYRAHFPMKKSIRKDQKIFEASPLYIFSPLAPKRIAELIPDVKMIAMLRNPTERAISHYFHECRMGRESLPIMEALQAEEERLRPFIANEDYRHTVFIHHSYKSRGRYKEQISRYLEYFSREQMLILKSDDLFSRADEVLKKVFAFVGVKSDFQITDLEARNISPNRTKVDDEVYQYLDHYFLPHNQALNELVGQDFGWDKPR